MLFDANLVTKIFAAILVIVVLSLVVAGFLFFTGGQEAVQSARERIKNNIFAFAAVAIGLTIVAFLWSTYVKAIGDQISSVCNALGLSGLAQGATYFFGYGPIVLAVGVVCVAALFAVGTQDSISHARQWLKWMIIGLVVLLIIPLFITIWNTSIVNNAKNTFTNLTNNPGK